MRGYVRGDGMVMVDMHEYVLGDGGYAGILLRI